jgi:catechol 2,3-dioxygenase-like lactoylglutathione lyase family enzyme
MDRSSLDTGAVHHITLTVSDIGRSAEFYTNVLGFQVVAEFGPRVALTNGSVLLVLTPPPDPAKALANDRFDENRIGLDHVSLAVRDKAALEKAAVLLDGHGISHGELKDLGPGFAIHVMAVRDPDNIQLELTAPYPG